MKTKPDLELRDLCGEKVIVAEDGEGIDFSRVVHFNESAAFLWEALAGREFTEADMVELLCREYEVGESDALVACRSLAARWLVAGVVETSPVDR